MLYKYSVSGARLQSKQEKKGDDGKLCTQLSCLNSTDQQFHDSRADYPLQDWVTTQFSIVGTGVQHAIKTLG